MSSSLRVCTISELLLSLLNYSRRRALLLATIIAIMAIINERLSAL